jgi:hypothetical protein
MRRACSVAFIWGRFLIFFTSWAGLGCLFTFAPLHGVRDVASLGYSCGVERASCPSSAQNRTTAAANLSSAHRTTIDSVPSAVVNETLVCVVANGGWACVG